MVAEQILAKHQPVRCQAYFCAMLLQQGQAKMTPDQITQIIPDNCSCNGGQSDPLNSQMVGFEAVERCGDDTGFSRNGQAHAFHQNKQGHDTIAVVLKQRIQMM